MRDMRRGENQTAFLQGSLRRTQTSCSSGEGCVFCFGEARCHALIKRLRPQEQGIGKRSEHVLCGDQRRVGGEALLGTLALERRYVMESCSCRRLLSSRRAYIFYSVGTAIGPAASRPSSSPSRANPTRLRDSSHPIPLPKRRYVCRALSCCVRARRRPHFRKKHPNIKFNKTRSTKIGDPRSTTNRHRAAGSAVHNAGSLPALNATRLQPSMVVLGRCNSARMGSLCRQGWRFGALRAGLPPATSLRSIARVRATITVRAALGVGVACVSSSTREAGARERM